MVDGLFGQATKNKQTNNMQSSLRQTFSDASSFDAAWNDGRGQGAPPTEVAERVAKGLAGRGFRLFHNGGLPRLDRRRDKLQEEIVFAPGPGEGRFAVRFHLNHEGVGEVRARFWRPATRAPLAIASGDIGLLEMPPVRSIWSATNPIAVAEAIRVRIDEDLLPWLETFDDPATLQETLFANTLPLVDVSTALEIMIAEFGVRDARRFLRARIDLPIPLGAAVQNRGFDLNTDRLAAIAAYYRL